MVKKNDLSCVFTPATGEAVILKDGKPVVEGHGLKDVKEGWLERFQTTQKAGQDYVGTASLPGVGDPDKASAKFHVFRLNAESMGCSVPELGIENVRAPRVSASAPAPKP